MSMSLKSPCAELWRCCPAECDVSTPKVPSRPGTADLQSLTGSTAYVHQKRWGRERPRRRSEAAAHVRPFPSLLARTEVRPSVDSVRCHHDQSPPQHTIRTNNGLPWSMYYGMSGKVHPRYPSVVAQASVEPRVAGADGT